MTPAEFRAIRIAADLTPEQLCERLGLATGLSGRRYIRMLEAGDREVSGPVGVIMRGLRDGCAACGQAPLEHGRNG